MMITCVCWVSTIRLPRQLCGYYTSSLTTANVVHFCCYRPSLTSLLATVRGLPSNVMSVSMVTVTICTAT